MPWHVGKSSSCPTGKPWAVIKDSDGSVAGCHPSKSAAQKQMSALYAGESSSPISPTMAENGSPPRANLVRARHSAVEFRASDDGGMPTLFGHFAVFNRWTEINSFFEGHFLERIAPGAFRKTFKENRERIRALFQHGRDPQIGDKPLGPVEELREEEAGAYYEVPLLDTAYNRELIPGLEAGLYGASFRFEVMREDFHEEPDASEENPKAIPERTLKEVRLHEFGPVTFPAYAEATADVRSLTDHFIFEELARDPDRIRELLRLDITTIAPTRGTAPSDPTPELVSTSDQERRASRDYLTSLEEATWQL